MLLPTSPGSPALEDEHLVGAGGEPAFTNSWTDAAAAPDGAFGPLRFYLHNGRCYVAGAISGGTPPSSAFVLPDGYRPAYAVVMTHHIGGVLSISDDLTTPGEAVGAVATSGELTITSAVEDNVIIRVDFRVA